MTTSLARCGCRGRIFVEKESATQVQVEDHQRGFCDDDEVSMLCEDDDQGGDGHQEEDDDQDAEDEDAEEKEETKMEMEMKAETQKDKNEGACLL